MPTRLALFRIRTILAFTQHFTHFAPNTKLNKITTPKNISMSNPETPMETMEDPQSMETAPDETGGEHEKLSFWLWRYALIFASLSIYTYINIYQYFSATKQPWANCWIKKYKDKYGIEAACCGIFYCSGCRSISCCCSCC
jgi:hypothetical protein